jgi:GTPase SAR1 family protein
VSELLTFNYKNSSKIWMVNSSGEYLNGIKDYFANNNIGQDAVNSFVNNAIRILSYCPNPSNNEIERSTGLIIGKVQSGKTSNFLSLIALAFDNNYDLVIVFGGVKKNLVKQNRERIEEYFSNESVVVFDTETNKDQITEETMKKFIKDGKKIIIVTLKSASKINNIKNKVYKPTSYFLNKPLLIIDDEGDEYSLNNNVEKKTESATYKSIKNLIKDHQKCAFLSVTATPQANMIIDGLDILSPDFGVLVNPGIGYKGLNEFHDVESMNCIELQEDEPSLIDPGVPESFRNALARFFVSASLQTLKNRKKSKYSMLVHPTWKVEGLKGVYEKTHGLVNLWAEMADDLEDTKSEPLLKYLNKALDEYQNEGVEINNRKAIIEYACKKIQLCGVFLITGNSQFNDNDRYYDFNIYIGGQMLGRGLTIKGLIITYIIRAPKGVSTVDTTQQRARWFGYKEDYFELCRIYATNRIISDFNEIRIHENRMWELIDSINGKDFKNLKRFFYLGNNMRLTRSSVGKTQVTSFNSWNYEKVFNDQFNNLYNESLMNDFKMQNFNKIIKDNIGVNTYHEVIRDFDISDFYDFVLKNFLFPSSGRLTSGFFRFLNSQVKEFMPNLKCDIVWMRSGQESKHPIVDLSIPNYFVGRRPKNVPIEQCTYLGDQKYTRNNTITFQLYNIVNADDLNQRSLTIACYIPTHIVSKLMSVVERG